MASNFLWTHSWALISSARRRNAVVAIAFLGLASSQAPTARADDAFWTQVMISGQQSGKNRYAAIYDPVNRRKVTIGGNANVAFPSGSSDVFTLSLDTDTWERAMPSGPTPTERELTAAVYDPIRLRMVMFGGGGLNGPAGNDVWELQLPPGGAMTWRQVSTQGAPLPWFPDVVTYDSVRDRMLLFGGPKCDYADPSDPCPRTNEVWALNFSDSTWEQLSILGTELLRLDLGATLDPGPAALSTRRFRRHL